MSERDNRKTEQDNCLNSSVENCYNHFPPGHFYSPIPSLDDIIKNEKRIWNKKDLNLPGIDLNIEEQLNLLDEFDGFYAEMPFTENKTNQLRYCFQNNAFNHSDAIFLYFMIRYAKPKNIIEVGSGFSSCVSLDTNELFFNNSIKFQFIEPYPQLLNSLIKEQDHTAIKIHESNLQDVPIDLFKNLEPNDILFIDSTHVSKINSDVNYIIHEILPVLSKGVYIHFHDISFTFEYPKEWIFEGRFWNEQYILRAFLQYNSQFKIVLFNTHLAYFYEEKLMQKFPLIFKNTGGSIWIKKI
jgi:hypothetical protein